MADEEIHRLVVAFEARTDKFGEILVKSQEDFSKALAGMEKRQEQFGRTIAAHADRAGRDFASRLMGGIAAGLSFAAIEKFVTTQLDNAANIRKQAATTGLSTDTVQAFSVIANKSGIDPEELDRGLDKFAANLGESKLKVTEFGRELKKLGVDTHGTTEEVFYRFIDQLNRVGDVTQRDAVLAAALGGKNVSMAAFVAQGSAAIRDQSAALFQNGEIIDEKVLKKIDDLGAAWIDLKSKLTVIGANVLSGFAGELHQITGDIKDDGFQTSLKNLGKVLADVAGYIVQIAGHPNVLEFLAAVAVGGKFAGVPGAIIGGAAATGHILSQPDDLETNRNTLAALKDRWRGIADTDLPPRILQQIGQLQADIDLQVIQQRNLDHPHEGRGSHIRLADVPAAVPASPGIDLSDSLTPHHKSEAETTAEDVIKRGHEELARIAAELDGMGLSAGQIAAVAYRARSEAQLREVKGHLSPAQQADFKATAQAIQLKTDQFDAGRLSDDAFNKAAALIAKYREETAALGLTAAAAERLAFIQEQLNDAAMKKIELSPAQIAAIQAEGQAIEREGNQNKDAKDTFDRQLQVTDQLRNGLEGVAEAGLNGFKSLKSAAAGFLEQMAQLILKLYVLDPLMKAAFGEPGQVGQGAIGSILFPGGGKSPAGGTGASGSLGGIFSDIFGGIGSFFGFADGGEIRGPGGGRDDRVIARVSNGEYIVNAGSTSKYREVLEAINQGRLQRFADGGFVRAGGEDGAEAVIEVSNDRRRRLPR